MLETCRKSVQRQNMHIKKSRDKKNFTLALILI